MAADAVAASTSAAATAKTIRLVVMTPPLSGRDQLGVRPDDHGVGDGDDLVHRQVCARGMPADRLRAGRLVDADGADGAAAFLEDVAPNPAHLIGHFLVADLPRALGGFAELLGRPPAASAQDHVGVHGRLLPLVSPDARPRVRVGESGKRPIFGAAAPYVPGEAA